MRKLGKNATTKREIIRMLIHVRMAEIISTMFGGESITNTDKYIEKVAKLDARKKGFKKDVVKIMTEYAKYLESKSVKPKPTFAQGGVVAKGDEKILVGEKTVPDMTPRDLNILGNIPN